MKKILAVYLLTTFALGFFVCPAFAIMETKQSRIEQTTILDDINYDWWKNLNDPYLEKFIATAINKNSDIKTAALKLEQAKINVMSARAGQLPTLSIGASPVVAKFPTQTKTQGSFALPVTASWELDLFGKNWDKTKSAKKMVEATKYQVQSSDIAIISMVAGVYYNVVKLDKIIEIQKKLVSDRKQIYDLMKLSNSEGIASTSDLILAEKAYVMSENDLLDYNKSRENALNALAVLIGDSPNNTKEYERISADELNGNFDIPESISGEIITNRPDYKALEKQLEAAGLNIRVAKKEFLPSINILGLMAFLATSTISSMDWKNSIALASASVDLPIFTGFRRVANLKMNKNKYDQMIEEFQKVNLTAIQEVNDSLYNLKSDNQKYLNNVKALDIQNKDFKYTTSKYQKGIISRLDVLQHEESLIYMQMLALQSKMDCYIDRISLYKTTGAKI